MEIVFHPLVRRDVSEIIQYYLKISSGLSHEFEIELHTIIDQAASNPLRFPETEKGFRRANLKRFPFHVLYDIHPHLIRVMLVRHNKRNPAFGLDRV